jgi:hypothetical protein
MSDQNLITVSFFVLWKTHNTVILNTYQFALDPRGGLLAGHIMCFYSIKACGKDINFFLEKDVFYTRP